MIREQILRLEQTLERVFGGKPPREALEVRRAVIEALVAQARPIGRDRKLLPFNRATVHVVAQDAADRRVFKDALDPADLAREIGRELERTGAQLPHGFEVVLRLVRAPGKGWTPGARFHVTVSQTDAPVGEPASTEAVRPVTAVLRVLDGDARPRTLTTEATRINLGRQIDVLDRTGKPVRHNDVAFVGDDEVSRSVSRAHAYVTFDRVTRAHRVFDENSAYGTEVERDGRRIVVPAGRDGLRLRSGDAIHLGRAAVRFEIK
jgi:FHA domain